MIRKYKKIKMKFSNDSGKKNYDRIIREDCSEKLPEEQDEG